MSETAIVPDDKDWTWVLREPCPECGFEAAAATRAGIADVVRDNARTWQVALTLADAAVRPDPATWSTLEYACHVRDVDRIFDVRIGLMLDEDEPTFANWDQDETAVAERYAEQDPATVADELMTAAETVAARYESVPDDAWERRGFRSNGSEFTVDSLGRYHLHDLVHHAWDVRAAVARATVESYDANAAEYGIQTANSILLDRIEAFTAAVGAGGRVLEIGSGSGRDARLLEERGLSVRRTDITPGFVEIMRADGFPADLLDPLTDDLADPQRPGTPYDAVWANACLLHVERADLPIVLSRLAAATRAGGRLFASFKEGDGERLSVHGSIAAPRRFVYWREEALRAAVGASGWVVEAVDAGNTALTGERWLEVRASRP